MATRKADAPPEPEAAVGPEEIEAERFDLVGADGRRIIRWSSRSACEEFAAELLASTGEKTELVTSAERFTGR